MGMESEFGSESPNGPIRDISPWCAGILVAALVTAPMLFVAADVLNSWGAIPQPWQHLIEAWATRFEGLLAVFVAVVLVAIGRLGQRLARIERSIGRMTVSPVGFSREALHHLSVLAQSQGWRDGEKQQVLGIIVDTLGRLPKVGTSVLSGMAVVETLRIDGSLARAERSAVVIRLRRAPLDLCLRLEQARGVLFADGSPGLRVVSISLEDRPAPQQ